MATFPTIYSITTIKVETLDVAYQLVISSLVKHMSENQIDCVALRVENMNRNVSTYGH